MDTHPVPGSGKPPLTVRAATTLVVVDDDPYVLWTTALMETQARISSIALLHETLYQSANHARVQLADYLRKVATRLFRAQVDAAGAVRLVLELAAVEVATEQAIPCGLLMNELLTNAIKHAFPENHGGEVRVGIQALADGPGWRLRVADNGVGLPPDFDMDNPSSLGLKLVTNLTRQLGGLLTLGTGPGAVLEVECRTG